MNNNYGDFSVHLGCGNNGWLLSDGWRLTPSKLVIGCVRNQIQTQLDLGADGSRLMFLRAVLKCFDDYDFKTYDEWECRLMVYKDFSTTPGHDKNPESLEQDHLFVSYLREMLEYSSSILSKIIDDLDAHPERGSFHIYDNVHRTLREVVTQGATLTRLDAIVAVTAGLDTIDAAAAAAIATIAEHPSPLEMVV